MGKTPGQLRKTLTIDDGTLTDVTSTLTSHCLSHNVNAA